MAGQLHSGVARWTPGAKHREDSLCPMMPGRSVDLMVKGRRLVLAAATACAAGFGLAALPSGAVDDCASIVSGYAQGAALEPQLLHGTHGSVVIAPEGSKEMVELYQRGHAHGCAGFEEPRPD